MANLIKKYKFTVVFIMLFFLFQITFLSFFCLFFILSDFKHTINFAEKNLKNSAILNVEQAFQIAQSSVKTQDYSPLISFFQNQIATNQIFDASFVMDDKKITAHSNKKSLNTTKETENTSDNLIPEKPTLIETKPVLTNYDINSIKPYFSKRIQNIIECLSKYNIVPDLNVSGILASKSISDGNDSVWTVNIIVSKTEVYNSIRNKKKTIKILLGFIIVYSVLPSLILSLFFMFNKRHSKISSDHNFHSSKNITIDLTKGKDNI